MVPGDLIDEPFLVTKFEYVAKPCNAIEEPQRMQ